MNFRTNWWRFRIDENKEQVLLFWDEWTKWEIKLYHCATSRSRLPRTCRTSVNGFDSNFWSLLRLKKKRWNQHRLTSNQSHPSITCVAIVCHRTTGQPTAPLWRDLNDARSLQVRLWEFHSCSLQNKTVDYRIDVRRMWKVMEHLIQSKQTVRNIQRVAMSNMQLRQRKLVQRH